jgi:type IV secretory pathway VirB2 component (pilin)
MKKNCFNRLRASGDAQLPVLSPETAARLLLLCTGIMVVATPVFAQAGASPWENAVTQLQTSFTGPIARGLSLVAIVIGGLMFAYSEGAAKKTFAGILFGCGAALAANNFMTWLFP